MKISEINEIWEDCLIVFDTNILLHLYRYNIDLREKLLDILYHNDIKNKLWIPSKVYEEFLKNRINVICEQWSIEQKIKSTIDKIIRELIQKLKTSFTSKYHPYIDLEEISSILESSVNKVNNKIEQDKQSNYSINLNNDSLLEKILEVLSDKIEPEISEKELQTIYEEGKERYSKKIPPGFEDLSKGEPDCYSDFIIWKSILKKGKDGHNIIFISDDEKNDWWRIEKGHKIGAQPLLLKEFYTETNKNILFYDSNQFYKYADEFITKKNILTQQETDQISKINFQTNFGNLNSVSKINKPKKKVVVIKRRRYSVDQIYDWFMDNYEDPANGVPYMSSEGGYIYWNGGPYEPDDVIQSEYPNIDQETLDEVLDRIYADGYEWVLKGTY